MNNKKHEKLNQLFLQLSGRSGITDLLVYMYYAHTMENYSSYIYLGLFSKLTVEHIRICMLTVKKSIRRLIEFGLLIPNKTSNYKLIPITNFGHLEYFGMKEDVMNFVLVFGKHDIFKFGKRGLGKSGLFLWLKFLHNKNPISISELTENSFVSKQTVRKKIKQMLKHKMITQNESGYVKGKFYFNFDEILYKMQKALPLK